MYGKCKTCGYNEYLDDSGDCPVCRLTEVQLERMAAKIVLLRDLYEGEPKLEDFRLEKV
jgi:hypothetical protein